MAERPSQVHTPPADCPVCGSGLHLSRLGCESCGTELSGWFEPCRFCSLDEGERGLLTEFLRSRGNLKAVERYLGVSYPTARNRVDVLLGRLGIDPGDDADQPETDSGPSSDSTLDVLRRLAEGEVSVDEALDRL